MYFSDVSKIRYMNSVPERNNQEPCPHIPTGPAVLAERQQAHEDVLCGNTGFDGVVLKLDALRRATENGYTSSDYLGGDYTFVSTSTMNDEKISELGWESELETVRDFSPAFHIPTDYPVYENDCVAVRDEHINKLIQGTSWMVEQLSDVSTRVLPLLKGVTSGERERFYRFFRQMQFGGCAFYGTQYFTEGAGFSELNDRLYEIQAEAPDLDIFLLGLLSPRCLSKVPSNVVGSTGQAQWRKRIGLRDSSASTDEMRQRSMELADEVTEAISAGQTALNAWRGSDRTEVSQ